MRFIRCIIALLCAATLIFTLSGCTRVVRSQRDELVMYSWRSELENGNIVSLEFEEDSAAFRAENERYTLDISGYCLVDDSGFVICDGKTEVNYAFSYILHGDCVELSCFGGTVTLDKIITDNSDSDL